MLLQVCGEGLVDLVVGLDILDVGTVPATWVSSIWDYRGCLGGALLLVFLQDLVSVVFDTASHLSDEIGGLVCEEPAQGNNTLRDCAEVVEERRSSVRLANVVDAVRSIVEARHELRGLLLGLSSFRGHKEVGALGFEGLKDYLGLRKL